MLISGSLLGDSFLVNQLLIDHYMLKVLILGII